MSLANLDGEYATITESRHLLSSSRRQPAWQATSRDRPARFQGTENLAVSRSAAPTSEIGPMTRAPVIREKNHMRSNHIFDK